MVVEARDLRLGICMVADLSWLCGPLSCCVVGMLSYHWYTTLLYVSPGGKQEPNPPTLWVIRRVDEPKAPCTLSPRGRVYPPPIPSQRPGTSPFNLAVDPSPGPPKGLQLNTLLYMSPGGKQEPNRMLALHVFQ